MQPLPPNELYQYAVVSALMDGVASDGLPLSSLLAQGGPNGLGLGTFRSMTGELIILDGTAFQMKHDGTVVPAPGSPGSDHYETTSVTPFAMITNFHPDTQRSTRAELSRKDAVDGLLSRLAPDAVNTHVAFRFDGTFKRITVRTAAGQCFPGEGLRDVASRQAELHLGPLKGTVVGFRSPQFLQGVAVAGVHMHFISEDRAAGGHVLALETEGEVEVQVAEIWRTVMDLPRSEEFNKAKLGLDAVGIASVEG